MKIEHGFKEFGAVRKHVPKSKLIAVPERIASCVRRSIRSLRKKKMGRIGKKNPIQRPRNKVVYICEPGPRDD